jgi:hypothetical protein
LREFCAWQARRFVTDPAAASKVAGGEAGTIEAATWTLAARALLNLDEFLTRE